MGEARDERGKTVWRSTLRHHWASRDKMRKRNRRGGEETTIVDAWLYLEIEQNAESNMYKQVCELF